MADPAEMRAKFFQAQRDNIERNVRGQQQDAGDALSRRFAAIGQSGSGAAINAQIKSQQAIDANANEARSNLSGQELQANMADAEAQKARDFQAQQADKDAALKREMFDTENKNKLSELDLARQQFLLDKDTTAFNRALAEAEAGKKNTGLLGSVFGDSLGSAGGVARVVANPIQAITGGGK
jgi:hypothetical protein